MSTPPTAGAPPGQPQPWTPTQMPPAAAPPTARMSITLPWGMVNFLGRALGFVLIFIGTLLAVVGVSVGGNCYTDATACVGNTGWMSGVANYILAAKILWVLGLFFLGAGTGMKLHWELRMPAGATSDQVTWMVADRRYNTSILIVTIVLMAVLLLTINMAPILPGGIP